MHGDVRALNPRDGGIGLLRIDAEYFYFRGKKVSGQDKQQACK